MSYLSKVQKPIAVIGKIEPDRIYDTSDAVRVLSCGPSVLQECAKAGDIAGAEKKLSRWKFSGRSLLEFAARDAEMRKQISAERAERRKAYKRDLYKRKAEHEKKTKQQKQQPLPIPNEKFREAILAEIDRLRARIAQLK